MQTIRPIRNLQKIETKRSNRIVPKRERLWQDNESNAGSSRTTTTTTTSTSSCRITSWRPSRIPWKRVRPYTESKGIRINDFRVPCETSTMLLTYCFSSDDRKARMRIELTTSRSVCATVVRSRKIHENKINSPLIKTIRPVDSLDACEIFNYVYYMKMLYHIKVFFCRKGIIQNFIQEA